MLAEISFSDELRSIVINSYWNDNDCVENIAGDDQKHEQYLFLSDPFGFCAHGLEKYPFKKLIALLRYNSSTVQFTHLKCTNQELSVYSQSCANITIIL